MSLISSIQGLSPSLMKGQGIPANGKMDADVQSIIDSAKKNALAKGSFNMPTPHEMEGLAPAQFVQPGQGIDPGSAVRDFIHSVDGKQKAAAAETKKVMLGESDNLHQSMIASQESSVAFTMMVEVRNKLMESYQTLMRMQI